MPELTRHRRDVRVVVVDDHPRNRRAVAQIVAETAGFTLVGAAESGERAVDLARRLRANLVLMDINLPGIDGLEATRQLVAGPDPPFVVLLSNFADGELDFRECGAVDYIAKSAFGPDRLTAVWHRICRT